MVRAKVSLTLSPPCLWRHGSGGCKPRSAAVPTAAHASPPFTLNQCVLLQMTDDACPGGDVCPAGFYIPYGIAEEDFFEMCTDVSGHALLFSPVYPRLCLALSSLSFSLPCCLAPRPASLPVSSA